MLSRSEASNLQLWRSADTKFALFDAAVCPKRVARHLVAGPETVTDVLLQIGMDEPLRATGGFFRAAVAQLVNELPQSLNGRTAGPAWERSAGLLEVTRLGRDRRGRELMKLALRFPEMGGDVARASLSPWLGRRDPLTRGCRQHAFSVNTADAVIEAAAAGLGIARVMSYQAATAISEGRVATILRGLATDPVPVSLVHRSQRVQPLKRRAFLEFVLPRLTGALASVHEVVGSL